MTEEMLKVARELERAAKEYRRLYEEENGKTPVVWIKNNETEEGVFISDSFNTELIKNTL
jgi:hypothetical protein